MRWYSNLKVGWKLGLAFGVLVLVFSAGSLLIIKAAGQAKVSAEEVHARSGDLYEIMSVSTYTQVQYGAIADAIINREKADDEAFGEAENNRKTHYDAVVDRVDTD